MSSAGKKVLIVLLAVGLAVPVLLVGAAYMWRSSPPPGAPKIGLSLASSFVIQRPLYEEALARAGGQALALKPTDDQARIEAMLDRIDGLLLTGGDDVDPSLYGGEPDNAGSTDSRRDAFEIELLRGALARKMPILGICRGIQILNVAEGGSIRNLRDDPVLSEHHGIELDSLTAHEVDVMPDTVLAGVVGAGKRRVNSFHGQAVDRVGPPLRVCARADDGVIEGIERPDRDFVIGVQWHPEISSLTDDTKLALFRELVRQADAYRHARGVTSSADVPAATE